MYCLYSFSVLQDKLFNFWYEGESLKKVLPARTTNSWLFGWLSFATLQPYSELPRINLIESTGLCRPVILSSEIVPEEGLATLSQKKFAVV